MDYSSIRIIIFVALAAALAQSAEIKGNYKLVANNLPSDLVKTSVAQCTTIEIESSGKLYLVKYDAILTHGLCL